MKKNEIKKQAFELLELIDTDFEDEQGYNTPVQIKEFLKSLVIMEVM